jgi:hypothetical protein
VPLLAKADKRAQERWEKKGRRCDVRSTAERWILGRIAKALFFFLSQIVGVDDLTPFSLAHALTCKALAYHAARTRIGTQ